MSTKTIHLNLFSKPMTILICILEDIKCENNIKEILPSLNCSLINSSLIYSYDQLTTAITRTVSNFVSGSMKTRSPYTELLYSLSPSTNVTESLKSFGLNESNTSAIAVRIIETGSVSDPEGAFENDLKTSLNCSILNFSLENLVKNCNPDAVKQIYKPTIETRMNGEICTSIATKNI